MKKRKIFETARTQLARRQIWISQMQSGNAGRELASIVSSARVTSPLIRRGPSGDGGYLLPDDFSGIQAILSPGVSDICNFDLEFAEQGLPVYMADASVERPPVEHENFHFTKKFLDVFESDQTITFENWLEHCGLVEREGDLLLQMDIEGAEYRVLSSMSEETLNRFRIMVMEVHNIEQVYSKIAGDLIISAFKKILKHFNIVHIHPNNNDPLVKVGGFETSPTMEFTFYRKDRPHSKETPETPHPLDADCVPAKPSVPLSKSWG